MKGTRDIIIGVAVIVGLLFGVGIVVQIVEKTCAEISRRIDPYIENAADRLADWTRPLWDRRRFPERGLRDLNDALEELNRLTDEHQRRVRGQ